MSKSLGNFTTIKDALARYRPEVIRTFVFTSHYSNPIDYSEAALEAAERGWERLVGALRLTREKRRDAPETGGESFLPALDEARARFIEAMDDDFNAPQAVAALQTLTGEVNKLLNSAERVGEPVLAAIETLYDELGGNVLGITPKTEVAAADAARQDGLIRLLIDMRNEARREKQFARSDSIRDQLKALGVALEDRPEGTIYRLE
jgi:cysteinyl-tRNA synthetase